jgi:hypothetical protein
MPLAPLAGILAIWLAASPAQEPPADQAPAALKSPGRFSATRLRGLPTIDGRAWIAANVHTTPSPGAVRVPPKAGFSLMLTDCGDHGDFVRCQLLFQRARTAAVRIDHTFTGWVFVTPDARYIVTEPLYVLDVREGKQYALFDALNIRNYTTIEAVSRDGRRLLISRRDCGMDCPQQQVEYYVLNLP